MTEKNLNELYGCGDYYESLSMLTVMNALHNVTSYQHKDEIACTFRELLALDLVYYINDYQEQDIEDDVFKQVEILLGIKVSREDAVNACKKFTDAGMKIPTSYELLASDQKPNFDDEDEQNTEELNRELDLLFS